MAFYSIKSVPADYDGEGDSHWDAGSNQPPFKQYTGEVNEYGEQRVRTLPAGGVNELWLNPAGFIRLLRLSNGAGLRDGNSPYANDLRKTKIRKGWVPANGCAKLGMARNNLPKAIKEKDCSGKDEGEGICECVAELQKIRQERHNRRMAAKRERYKSDAARQTEMMKKQLAQSQKGTRTKNA